MKRAVLIFLTVLGVLLVLAPFFPPIFRAMGMERLAAITDAPWTLTCHRIPERTMSFLGTKMAMCSRCTGIVTGLGLGLIIGRPYRGPKQLWITLGIASVLMFIEMVVIDKSWHSTRLFTGFLLAYPVAAAVRALARRG